MSCKRFVYSLLIFTQDQNRDIFEFEPSVKANPSPLRKKFFPAAETEFLLAIRKIQPLKGAPGSKEKWQLIAEKVR